MNYSKGNNSISKMTMKKSELFFLIISVMIFFSLGFKSQSGLPSGQTGAQFVIHNGNLFYLANTLVVKLKNQQINGLLKAQNLTAQLNQNFGQFKFTSAKEMFGTSTSETAFGLNRIMLVKYNSGDDPLYVSSKIKELSNVEWAEPKYVRRITFVPSDQYYSQQYNLAIIKAAQAWDISKGDTNVVIGIVDTGVDWPHPDLYANIWHNPHWQTDTNFPGDSIGWDFGGNGSGNNPTPDNNPIEDNPYHGTFVAGIASAVTNNGIGVAGIGYKCKLMPVKVTQANQIDPTSNSPYVIFGFEGIKYAADNGAKVINCSWGGGGYSNAEQNVINYAMSKGALVVAAAGNDGVSESFYPASYAGVLSVAATDQNDAVTSFSNYGENIDVCAPGISIFSTWQPNTYSSNGAGTSFSSPLAAGLAALVSSRFPNYTPSQVAEQIRVNSDNIDSLNPTYKYLLGGGRINAYKSLADSNSESVRAISYQFSDAAPGGNGDGIFQPGETITVGIKFMNYLSPIKNLTVALNSMNSYSTISNNTFSTSNVASLDSFDNSTSQFTIKLASPLPYDANLQYRLNYTDGNYSDFQVFSIPVNPSYSTQTNNNLALTIGSKGNFGFNDYPINIQGNGFELINGSNMLFEGALIIGNSSSTIEDAARGSDQNYEDSSFSVVQPFKIQIPGHNADQQGETIFNDDNAGASKLGISTKLQSFSFTGSPDNNYIILRYSFTNNSGNSISNFYAGLFCDWDLVDGQNDSTAYDYTGNFGYALHTISGFNSMVATALISSTNYGYWGILNSDTGSVWGIYNGFTSAEKWQAISSGIGKQKAGVGDISEVTSGGPYTISAGQTLIAAFAIAAGNSLTDLRTAINNARLKYQSIPTLVENNSNQIPFTYSLMQNYPNPFNPSTFIKYQIAKEAHVTLKIYDVLGREVEKLVDEEKPAGNYTVNFNASLLSSGVYFYKITSGNYSAAKKMVLMK
ncbi:MAG: S8 family peptidase [Bacteroidetes bacterium]|nr:S8 family peptidase [Bacteroidota bacterium]